MFQNHFNCYLLFSVTSYKWIRAPLKELHPNSSNLSARYHDKAWDFQVFFKISDNLLKEQWIQVKQNKVKHLL